MFLYFIFTSYLRTEWNIKKYICHTAETIKISEDRRALNTKIYWPVTGTVTYCILIIFMLILKQLCIKSALTITCICDRKLNNV